MEIQKLNNLIIRLLIANVTFAVLTGLAIHNQWSVYLIVLCAGIVGISFLAMVVEMLYQRIKQLKLITDSLIFLLILMFITDTLFILRSLPDYQLHSLWLLLVLSTISLVYCSTCGIARFVRNGRFISNDPSQDMLSLFLIAGFLLDTVLSIVAVTL